MNQILFVRLLALCSSALLAVACADTKTQQRGFTFSGQINGVQSGTVKLIRNDQDNRTSTTLDSVKMTDGKFVIKGQIAQPEMVFVSIVPGNWGFSVFLENSDITIQADTLNAEHYDWTAYRGDKGARIKEFKVSGSESHDQFMSYENEPALKKFDPIFAELGKAYDTTTDKEKNYAIKERLDSLGGIYAGIQKKWIDSFINTNPASPAGTYMLHNYYMFHEDLPIADMERMMGKISGHAKSTVYFKSLSVDLQKRQALLPGKLAPDFTLLKPDSTSFTLSSLRGKFVLLDFWASWCVPCRKAIPHWKEVYNSYHDRGLEIVGVTNDNVWKDWYKALDQEKMPWLQVADEFPVENMPARVGTLFMTPYLPTYILLDKEGKIILHNASKEDIDKKLKEVL